MRDLSSERVGAAVTEQQVANYKFDFIARLRTLIKRQGLDEEVFSELYEEPAP